MYFVFVWATKVDLYLMHCKYTNHYLSPPPAITSTLFECNILTYPPSSPSLVPHAYAAGPKNSTIRHSSGNGKVCSMHHVTLHLTDFSFIFFFFLSIPQKKKKTKQTA